MAANPQNNPNTNQNNNDQEQSTRLNSEVSAILQKSYIDFLKNEKIDRTKIKKHQDYIDRFFKYIKRGGNKEVLSVANKKTLNAFFSAIEDKGIKAVDLLADNNASISERIKPANSEKVGLERMLKKIYEETAEVMVGDDNAFGKFASMHGLDFTSSTGLCRMKEKSTIQSIASLKHEWKKFASRLPADVNQRVQKNVFKNTATMFYDQTEKMAATALLLKYRSVIEGQNSTKLLEDFDREFPIPLPIYNKNSYSGEEYEHTNSLPEIRGRRARFLNESARDRADTIVQETNKLLITNSDLIQAYKDFGGAENDEFDGLDSKSVNKRSTQTRIMFNKIVAEQFIAEYEKSKDFMDQSLKTVASIIADTPPTFNQLFKKYETGRDALIKIDPTLEGKLEQQDHAIRELQKERDSEHPDPEKNYEKMIDKERQKQQEDMMKVFLMQVSQDDAELGKIMEAAYDNNFNLSTLDKSQQQYLIRQLCGITLDDLKKQEIVAKLGIDMESLEKFTTELFDLDTNTISIPMGDHTIPIEFTKKGFLPTSIHKSNIDLEKMKDWRHLGFNLSIKVTPENEKYLQSLYEGAPFLFRRFGNKESSPILSEGYRVRITRNGKSHEGYLSLRGKEMENEKDQTKLERHLYSEPVNQYQTERELAYSEPIPDKEAHERSVDILEKTLHLNGDTIGGLILGHVAGEAAKAKDLDTDIKDVADWAEDGSFMNAYRDTLEQQALEQDKRAIEQQNKLESEQDAKNHLERARNEIQPRNKKVALEKGTSLRVQEGESEIFQPFIDQGFGEGGYRHCFEITDIDTNKKTIEFTRRGGEQKHSQEGVITMPLSPETFEKFRTNYGINLYKTPKLKGGEEGFFDQIRYLEEAGIPNVSDNLKTIGGQVKFNGSKFATSHSGENREAQYFGAMADNPETGKPTIMTFKVEPKSDGKVRVSGGELLKRGEKGEILQRYKYNKEMDYTTFLLFLGEHNLSPLTDDQINAFKLQQKEAYGAIDDGDLSNKKLEFFSLSDFGGFFKGRYSKFNDKRKEYNEERVDMLTDLMVTDRRLYQKMSNTLGFWGGWRSTWSKVDYDVRLEKAGKIMSKISAWKDRYAKEPDRSPVSAEILKMVLQGPFPNTARLYQVAGAFLYMMEKAGGMYVRAFAPYAGQGLWVRALLGDAHRAKYKRQLADLEAKLKADPTNEDLRAQIQQSEALYLNIAIDGADEVLKFRFGIDFADAIMPAYQGSLGTEKINSTANALTGIAQFGFIFDQKFRAELQKGQTAKALAGLKAAASLATRSYEVEKIKGGILLILLSGVNMYGGDSESINFLVQFSRKIGFLPGMWMEDFNCQTKTARLLQMITSDFYTETGYNIENFGANNYGQGMKNTKGGYTEAFMKRWNTARSGDTKSRGSNITEFLDMKSLAGDHSLLGGTVNGKQLSYEDRKLIQELIGFSFNDSTSTITDLNNKEFYRNPMTVPKTVAQQFMNFRGTDFAGDDNQKESAQIFRRSFAEAIPTDTVNDDQFKTTTRFIMKKFADTIGSKYFTGSNENDLIRALGVVQNIGKDANIPNKRAEIDFLLHAIITMNLQSAYQGIPNEIDAVGDRFKRFLENNIASIDGDIIEETFGPNKREMFENPGDYVAGLGFDKREIDKKVKERTEAGNTKPLFNQRLRNIHRGMMTRGQGLDFEYQKIMNKYDIAGQEKEKQTQKAKTKVEELGEKKKFVALKDPDSYDQDKKPPPGDPNPSAGIATPQYYDDDMHTRVGSPGQY